MSIQEQISRISDAKNDIVNSIQSKGVSVPDGTKIDALPTYVDAIATANLQSNKTVTPSESKQTVTPDNGYNGLSQVTVNAVSSTYVGSGVAKKSSSDLTASGATITAPAGYYASAASQSVTTATRAGTSITTTADSTNAKLTLSASNNQSTGYVIADTSKNTATKVITLTASGATVTATDNSSTPVKVSKSVATATRAGTSITTTADDTNDKLTLTASNNQTTGYVTADTSKNTATKVITLTASGATVTATDNSSTPVKISKSVATANRAPTTLTSAKSNNSLVFTATNSQSTGYVTSDTSKNTATKTVSISRSGATVTATDGANSISSTVPDASITVNDGVVTVGTAGYVGAGTTLYELPDTEIVVIPDDADDVVQIRASGGKASAGTEFSLTVDQPSINIDNGVVTATATLQENEDFVDGRNPASISQTSTLNLGISSIGSATGSTAEAANRTIGYGQQATISAGYYPTTRIVRNSVAGATRAPTTLTSAKSNNTLVFTASNPQTTGYVTADTSKNTATKTVSLSRSGATVTASDGTNSISSTIGSGSATTPATTITANPSLSTSYTSGSGYKMSVSKTQSVTPTVSAGYVSSGTAGTITVSGSAYVPQSSTGSATTSTTDTATRTIGYGQQTTIGAGYYPSARIIRNSVSAGKATTPATTITKNPTITVSSGIISASVSGTQSVTPSVTAGYVSSGTAGTITVSGSFAKKATDLDTNLVASNIKNGVKIFGVTGNYTGGGGSVPTTTIIIDTENVFSYGYGVDVYYTVYENGQVSNYHTYVDAFEFLQLSSIVVGSTITFVGEFWLDDYSLILKEDTTQNYQYSYVCNVPNNAYYMFWE